MSEELLQLVRDTKLLEEHEPMVVVGNRLLIQGKIDGSLAKKVFLWGPEDIIEINDDNGTFMKGHG